MERVRIGKKKDRKRHSKRSFERKVTKLPVPTDTVTRVALKVLLVYWILIMLFLIGVIANLPFFREILCSNSIC